MTPQKDIFGIKMYGTRFLHEITESYPDGFTRRYIVDDIGKHQTLWLWANYPQQMTTYSIRSFIGEDDNRQKAN